jgi:hypothetical protein
MQLTLLNTTFTAPSMRNSRNGSLLLCLSCTWPFYPMLAHLHTTYGPITQAELETNCNCLTADWMPDEQDPTEDLWLRICEIQCFALASNEPISNSTALCLTLEVLEKTGIFISATKCWREIDKAAWMLPNFQLHFTKADKECCHKLTAQTAGYHGDPHCNYAQQHPSCCC